MKDPTDILALGNHLVSQLGLTDTNDTVSKWMAHHLAEKIIRVQEAETPEKKKNLIEEAEDLILKIWEKRLGLSESINPLNKYEDVVSGLRLLTNPNPVKFPWSNEEDIDDYMAEIFELNSKIIFQFLMMKYHNILPPEKNLEEIIDFYSEDEKYLLDVIPNWARFALHEIIEIKVTEGESEAEEVRPEEKEINYKEEILETIISLENKLNGLKEIIKLNP